MTTKTIRVDDATAAELREFAANTLNLDIAPASNKGTILAKLDAAGFNGKEITVTDQAAMPPAQKIETTTSDTGKRYDEKGREIVRIIIAREDKPGGDEAVQGCHNGVPFEIIRGVPVDVPKIYYNVLKNARGTRYANMRQGLEGPQIVPAYPVNLIG